MKKLLSLILVVVLSFTILPLNVFAATTNNSFKMVGDLDLDEEITDWDGVLLARYLAGWNVDVPDTLIFDIDGDGEITDWDGVMFDRTLAGWSVITEVGKKLAFNITYLNTKGATNTNPNSLQYGNVQTNLLEISAPHYTFDGWYVDNQKYTSIPANQNGDLSLTAKWTPIEYNISYNNTKGASNSNPTHYNIESSTIALSNINAEGYIFNGWYNGDTRITSIPVGSSGNIVLTAKWTPCDYSITYNNTKGAINNNATGFNTDSDTIILLDLHKEGYTFDGWYNNDIKVTQIPKGTIGNVDLTAKWTPITYSATFVAEGEIVATRYFTIEDSVLDNIPNVPSKAGYTGAWQSYTITANNITIYPDYTLNEYTITYSNTKGAENFNPTNYAITTTTFELLDLQYDGYNFEGWYKGNTKVEQIEKGSYGNISLTAKWSTTSYTITYSNTKGATNNNPLEYTVETGTIYLKNISAEHYTFDGWYLNGNKVLSIPAGNIGDIELVAHWTPISYNLLYQNTKGATNSNPVSYTVEDVIILQDISVDGYIFDGWYLNDEKVETINVGSYGQKILSARWTPVIYSITYKNTKDAENSNSTSYTIESNTILLSDISATGYIFDGWYINGSKVDKIDSGTFGDIEIIALWSPIVYKLTYEDTKGATNNNPLEYTIENAITLQDISVDGYTFDGWYVGDEKVTTISIGTIGDKILTAKWSLITYSITYANTKDVAHNNLCEYTIESEDIELANISKEGYVFNGWDLNGEVVTKVGSGSFGNIIITALWTPNTYSIGYVSKYDDITNDNPIIYNTDSEITLKEAYFDEYHTFEGWFLDSNFENEIEVLQGSRMENVTLYAKWSFDGTYISSGADFETIVYNPSGVYELTNNISISATICDSSNSFKGYINGNDYVIIGAKPFGVISGSATVRNIEVANHALADTNYGYVYRCIGNQGLITTNGGTIKFSASNNGFVYTTRYDNGAYDCVSGLVATNTGRIIGCYSNTTVDVTANSGGGLVGINNGTISNSYFNGSLTIERTYPVASGIAASGTGTIENCYSSGTVSIVAKASGTGPYASSAYGVTSGMVADTNMTIINSFSCVRATAGICVSRYGSLSVNNCYYASDLCFNAQVNYNYDGITYRYNDRTYGTGTNSSNFKSASFIENTLGWSTDYWCLVNGQLPKLIWE